MWGSSAILGAVMTKTLLPITDAVFDVGSATKRVRNLYQSAAIIGTTYIQGAGTGSNFLIIPDTSDAADNKLVAICGGGTISSTRGASFRAHGNEYSGSLGAAVIFTGAVGAASADVYLNATDTFGKFRIFDSSGNNVYNIRQNGDTLWYASNVEVLRITPSTGYLTYSTSLRLASQTSDGSDTLSLYLCGGGSESITRGASIRLCGNEASAVNGHAFFDSGNANGASFIFQLRSADSLGNFQIYNNAGTELIRVRNNGRLVFTQTVNTIGTNTSDTADNASLEISSAGAAAGSRGAYIVLYGNENAGAGTLDLSCGGSASLRLRLAETPYFQLNSSGYFEHANASAFIQFSTGQQQTGAGSALLGSNSPAGTPSAPNTWLKVKKSDNTTLYIPAWA